MHTGAKGEMTAFFALLFVVLIGLAGALMESASIQSAKNYRRADMNRAIESVFAEYQKELLEEYDLFALEASYESGVWEEDHVLERLSFYGAGSMEQELTRMELLTDGNGMPFLNQVSAWFRHRYGLDRLEGLLGQAQQWESSEEEVRQFRLLEQQKEEELASLLEEQNAVLPEADNPLQTVSRLKESPLLSLVLPEGKTVSSKQIDPGQQVSVRTLREGYGTFGDVAEEGTASRLALGVYLQDHFSSAVPDREAGEIGSAGALDYELEYIIGGKAGDAENLEVVLGRLLLIRLVSNFAFLQSDPEKKGEAAAAAGVLCTLLTVPAITEAVTQALLLAWAFGESVVDLRALLGAKKVPPVKTAESWQLSFSGLLSLGSEGDREEGRDTESGMSYQDYLQILLFLVSPEKAAMRSLDLIEQHLQTGKGFSWFRADQCITKISVRTRCSLRRGIRYTFTTYYGYR